ncbi:Membrane protein OS=Streptomyces antimycoticus OX=68175 GN=SANT12839_046210 PE=3 SV=1 [Streptomyces antimycoticus]
MRPDRQQAPRGASAVDTDTGENQKPHSDEAHSAFTPPLGIPMPPPPEDEHPTSELAVPNGLTAETSVEPEGSAFVPPPG